MESYKPHDSRSEMANIGKSVIIKGELSGSEDLFLDGEVEGTIELHHNSLTVGPNGRIRAHINASAVVIHGKLDGNVNGSDRVELKRTAVMVGDIKTQRIIIEDGAYFKGGVDIHREERSEKSGSSKTTGAAASTAAPVEANTTAQS